MILKSNFVKELVIIDHGIKDKKQLLRKIADTAAQLKTFNGLSADKINKALLDREQISSTGFRDGIAIPHCSFEELTDFAVGVYIHKKGLDFQSMDGKRTTVLFFIIGPSRQRNKHIRLLSSISRFSQSKDNVKQLLQCQTAEQVQNLITGSPENEGEKFIPRDKVLFHVFIQKMEYFEDILQILSEVVDGAISVMETENAGHYLHALPVFSTFWSEDVKRECKIILAVVDKPLANNVIRRINTTVTDIEQEPGILITVNELFYSNGSIDF